MFLKKFLLLLHYNKIAYLLINYTGGLPDISLEPGDRWGF